MNGDTKKNADIYVAGASEKVGDLEEISLGSISEVQAIRRDDPFAGISIDDINMDVVLQHLDDRTVEECLEILHRYNDYHEDDERIPLRQRKLLRRLEDGPLPQQSERDWETLVKFEAFLYYEWSIYPEVRMAVEPIETDEDEDYENFRVYFLGIIWACAGCVLDTFFAIRYPAITIGFGAVQMLIAESGKLWARLPRIAIPLGRGREFVINSGKPFTFREQMLASLIMLISLASPYSQNVVIAMANKQFFNFPEAGSFGFMILLTLTSSFMGFGLAGIMRAFLIYPRRNVWYDTLPLIRLNHVLVQQEPRENVNGWKLKTWEFFWIWAWFSFGWYWVTNLAFLALSYFDWMAWISPENVDLQAITGAVSGLGFNPPIMTFDFNIIGFTSIYMPLSIINSQVFGYMIGSFAILIIWYKNVRNTGFFPINSNTLYTNNGSEYNVAEVINPQTLKIDEDAYQNYSLPYWSASNIVVYGTGFMIAPALIVYGILNYSKEVINSFGAFWKGLSSIDKALDRYDDRFARKIRRYKEVPEWWYLLMLVISIAIAIGCVEGYKFTNTPVWTIFFTVGFSFIFLIPTLFLRSRTGYGFDINIIFELIMGLALPGNAPGVMVSKCFGTNFSSETSDWVSQQAMSHYSGISPRSLFRGQILSVLAVSFCEAGIVTWQVTGLAASDPDLCTADDKSRFRCTTQQTYFNSAVQWGTIGPRRVLNGLYPVLKWCFLIGAFFPIPFWCARKLSTRLASRYPEGTWKRRLLEMEWLHTFNEMNALNTNISWSPYNWWYMMPNWQVGWLFQGLIKKKYPRWFAKYAFEVYNASTIGNAFGALFAFFATSYHHLVDVDWWGNNVYTSTADYMETAARLGPRDLPSRGYFSPKKGCLPDEHGQTP